MSQNEGKVMGWVVEWGGAGGSHYWPEIRVRCEIEIQS